MTQFGSATTMGKRGAPRSNIYTVLIIIAFVVQIMGVGFIWYRSNELFGDPKQPFVKHSPFQNVVPDKDPALKSRPKPAPTEAPASGTPAGGAPAGGAPGAAPGGTPAPTAPSDTGAPAGGAPAAVPAPGAPAGATPPPTPPAAPAPPAGGTLPAPGTPMAPGSLPGGPVAPLQ
jgi:hypothetical protein